MLSARARNVLVAAGFNMNDPATTIQNLKIVLASGPRWRNCGRKTLQELAVWVEDPSGQTNCLIEEPIPIPANKTKVIIKHNDRQYRNYKKGEKGYIEGYATTAGRPIAVVVIGRRIEFIPIHSLEVTP